MGLARSMSGCVRLMMGLGTIWSKKIMTTASNNKTHGLSSISRGGLVAAVFALGTLGAVTAQAADRYSSTNVQILYGQDYELGEEKRTIMTLEHASGWEYGDNFFFVDVT